jgi:hypothetical protein
VVLVAGLLLVFAPLAYTDPPDPIWGLAYSQDDDIAAILAVVLNSCAIEAPPACAAGPLWTGVGGAEPPGDGIAARAIADADAPRGPPVALSRPA